MNKILLGMAAASAMFVASTANATLIDDFTTGGMSLSITGPTGGSLNNPTASTSTTVAAADALGGNRFVELTVYSPDDLSDGSSAVVDTSGGSYKQNGDTDVSTYVDMIWGNAPTLGGIELTGSHFALDVISIDQGNIDLTITVWDNDSSYSVTEAGAIDNTISLIAFSDFLNIEFDAIEKVMLTVDATSQAASDLKLNSFSTVPEPSVLALFGLGLLGLGLARRKI